MNFNHDLFSTCRLPAAVDVGAACCRTCFGAGRGDRKGPTLEDVYQKGTDASLSTVWVLIDGLKPALSPPPPAWHEHSRKRLSELMKKRWADIRKSF
jgi:hypothetical protein